jgi:hypothetical protein
MEIIEKQVEKVKEVPADNYGYNYGRRDINGKPMWLSKSGNWYYSNCIK